MQDYKRFKLPSPHRGYLIFSLSPRWERVRVRGRK